MAIGKDKKLIESREPPAVGNKQGVDKPFVFLLIGMCLYFLIDPLSNLLKEVVVEKPELDQPLTILMALFIFLVCLIYVAAFVFSTQSALAKIVDNSETKESGVIVFLDFMTGFLALIMSFRLILLFIVAIILVTTGEVVDIIPKQSVW